MRRRGQLCCAVVSPDFLRLWAAEIASGFGDRVTIVALAFVAWETTHSAVPTALAFVISALGYGLFGFFGGAFADALGHRRAMVLSDLGRAMLIGLIPLCLSVGVSLFWVYLLVFLATLLSAIFTPAKFAIVPAVTGRDSLGATNSLLMASDRTVEIGGVVIAGAVVAVLGAGAFFIDALSFVVSALLIARLRVIDPPLRPLGVRQLTVDARSGVAALWDDAVLRANTLYALTAQLSIPVFNGLIPVLVFREYRLGPEQLGLAQSAIAVGAIGMGIAYSRLFRGRRKGSQITLGFLALGVALIVLAPLPGFAASLVIFVFIGAANVVFLVPNVTLLQERTAPALRARVFAARLAVRNLSWLPVILVSSAIAETAGTPTALLLAGVFTLAVVAIATRFAVVRDA